VLIIFNTIFVVYNNINNEWLRILEGGGRGLFQGRILVSKLAEIKSVAPF
jgi:hypothetical protein